MQMYSKNQEEYLQFYIGVAVAAVNKNLQLLWSHRVAHQIRLIHNWQGIELLFVITVAAPAKRVNVDIPSVKRCHILEEVRPLLTILNNIKVHKNSAPLYLYYFRHCSRYPPKLPLVTSCALGNA